MRSPRSAGWGLRLVIVYLALLVVSHLLRPSGDAPATAPSVRLPVFDHGAPTARSTRLAYLDAGAREGGRIPVLLLHGSPGSRRDFSTVVPPLAAERRVIVPDLPGFGESRASLPDYSIAAHARYVDALLERLDLPRVHVVGFSMGGGVALELYDLAPQRVASITLLSAIGVQELELFGDYRLNHAIHAGQYAGLWLVYEATPHMGLLDGSMLDLAYARNFLDSDQRPLRGILERLEPPVLLLHGRDDFLVIPQVAREHARIVPHAELHMVEASHFMVFLDGPATATRLDDFFDRVESGEALDRSRATPGRRAAAVLPFDPGQVPPLGGFALLLAMAAIAAATLVSEDLTCIAVGLMVAQGRLGFLPGVVACCVGIFVGDLMLYLAGRWIGRPAVRRAPLRWLLRPERIEASSRWFSRRGAIVIGLSRFLPGTRLATYFAAGLLKTGFLRFALYFGAAVAVWTPLLVGLAALLGERVYGMFDRFERHALPAFVALLLSMLVLVKLIVPLWSRRGRRRLVGAWRRWSRWEFWPVWLAYPPVVLWIVALGVRYRSPLLFTAANPAIEAGGFVGESKWAILRGLGAARGHTVPACLLPGAVSAEVRIRRARKFIEERGLALPVVVKPDSGQRGAGVEVVRSMERLEARLAATVHDTLVQEYVPGEEFGIFYYRLPGESRGRILSITEKRMPSVRGDGRSTVEELVLDDARAVALADVYLGSLGAAADRVPARGERVRLVELGTHCRGAIFLDGRRLASEELRREIDAVSRGFEGFYFGRYDLRAPDAAALARGEFAILELNGVTSEATHVYDPAIGLVDAYRALCGQWSLAFEIGARNRRRGFPPAGLRELWRLLHRHRRQVHGCAEDGPAAS